MKIAIVTAIWQREALTKIFLKSVKRYWDDYGITTMIAGSEGVKSREMCLDAGAGYIETSNQPLSQKFNKSLMAAYVNYKPDAFMIMGSDDFVNNTLIARYLNYLELGFDIVGFKDCYFYNAKTKQSVYWPGYTVEHRQGESIGMARILSMNVFSRLKGRFWGNASAGLDWIMTQRLKKHKDLKRKIMSVKDGDYVLVDVKGFGNFCSIEQYETVPVDTGVFNTLPEFDEINKL